MPEVPRKVEHVYLPTLGPAVVAAWERGGAKPSKLLARSLISIIWIETGHGNLVCNSPGNVSVGGYYNGTDKIASWWHGDYWRPPWFADEGHRLHATMLEGKAPSAFAAYATLEAGLDHWVRVLKKNFPSVITAGQTGNAASLVKALHDSRYSTDYKPEHAASFEKLFDELATNAEYQKLEASLPGTLAVSGGGSGVGMTWLLLTGLGVGAIAGVGLWMLTRRKR